MELLDLAPSPTYALHRKIPFAEIGRAMIGEAEAIAEFLIGATDSRSDIGPHAKVIPRAAASFTIGSVSAPL